MLTLVGDLVIDAQSTLSSVHDMLAKATLQSDDKENDTHVLSVLDWLSGFHPYARHNRALSARQEGTCHWLLHTSQLAAWLSTSPSLLWLHGIPGAGKTILVASLIDHLAEGPKSRQGLLAYFYCDATDDESLRNEIILGSLLCQILFQLTAIPAGVENALKKAKSPTGSRQKLKLALLEKLLTEALFANSEKVIVLDGLDEVETVPTC